MPRAAEPAGKPGDALSDLRRNLTAGAGAPGGGPGFPGTGPSGAGPVGGGGRAGGGFAYSPDGKKNDPGDPKAGAGSSSTPSPDASSGLVLTVPSPAQPQPGNMPLPGLMPPGPGESKKTAERYYLGPLDTTKARPGDPKGADDSSQASDKGPGRSNRGYFRDLPGKDSEGDMGKPSEQLAQGKSQEAGGQKKDAGKEEQKTPDDKAGAKQPPAKTSRPGATAQSDRRAQGDRGKIIRTGELEFEIDVFDDAVADDHPAHQRHPRRLRRHRQQREAAQRQGAAARSSSACRRSTLDKFVLDLRKDLGKTGELKSQRIGSQDVTKQYTDMESRLRAARTMEERLINIIKTGKGEIKDLLAAERELGVWRTKIEEMEGEIRYYNNQVAPQHADDHRSTRRRSAPPPPWSSPSRST